MKKKFPYFCTIELKFFVHFREPFSRILEQKCAWYTHVYSGFVVEKCIAILDSALNRWWECACFETNTNVNWPTITFWWLRSTVNRWIIHANFVHKKIEKRVDCFTSYTLRIIFGILLNQIEFRSYLLYSNSIEKWYIQSINNN